MNPRARRLRRLRRKARSGGESELSGFVGGRLRPFARERKAVSDVLSAFPKGLNDLQEHTRKMLDSLTPTEREILKRRFKPEMGS